MNSDIKLYGKGKYEYSIDRLYSTRCIQKCHICGQKIDLCVDKFSTLADVVFYSKNRPGFSFGEKRMVSSDRQDIVGKFCCHDCHAAISGLMVDMNKKSRSKKRRGEK